MSLEWVWVGILIGVLLIIVLGVYIFRKLRQIKQLKHTHDQLERAQLQQHQELRHHLQESIQVISRAILDGQVELSEGCIRIKVLMDNFDPDLHAQEKFKVFSFMYSQLEHMPTHEARKQADKKLVRKLDEERFALEQAHQHEIQAAAKSLLLHLDGHTLH